MSPIVRRPCLVGHRSLTKRIGLFHVKHRVGVGRHPTRQDAQLSPGIAPEDRPDYPEVTHTAVDSGSPKTHRRNYSAVFHVKHSGRDATVVAENDAKDDA